MKTIYSLAINTVTAVHVGNGETLERDFDYVTHANKTWVLNADAIAAHLFDQDSPSFDRLLAATPPGKLLQPDDFDPSVPLFRYVMDGIPASTHTGAQLSAHIKSVYDTAYLPGSSIKGALRTVLARAIWTQEAQPLRRGDLGRNRKWAGQQVERSLLGKDPNYDLLRAMQISDTRPLDAALIVHNVRVFTGDHVDNPIPLECLQRNLDLTATLTIDQFLLTNATAQRKLRWRHGDLLHQLPALANAQARARIVQEQEWFQRHQPTSRAAKLYGALAGLFNKLQPHQFLLQVGWGGGYDSKTLTLNMTAQERAYIVGEYHLTRDNRNIATFPASRRAVAVHEQPYAPLGWLLIDMNMIG